MSDVQPYNTPQAQTPEQYTGQAGSCRYCGARLSPFFYFCLGCGTPYKSIDSVITPSRPMPLTETQLIERKAPHVWRMFWIFLGSLIGSGILAAVLFQEDRPELAMLLMMTVLFIVTCVFATIHWRTLWAQFKQFGFNHPVALISVALLIPTLGVNWLYHEGFFHYLLGLDGGESELDALRKAGLGETTIILAYCLYPAITEEIAFRGLIQHWLQVAIKPWRGLMLASGLFAIMHALAPLSWPYLFGVGMLLGWAKWRTRSLYPSMLIHFLHNLVVIELFG